MTRCSYSGLCAEKAGLFNTYSEVLQKKLSMQRRKSAVHAVYGQRLYTAFIFQGSFSRALSNKKHIPYWPGRNIPRKTAAVFSGKSPARAAVYTDSGFCIACLDGAVEFNMLSNAI